MGIEQLIAIANGRVVVSGIGTGAIGIGLIRVVHDVLDTLGVGHTSRDESVEGQATERLVLNLAAEHQLVDGNIIVIVGQLVEDIEASVEAGVIDIWIQTAAGVHSIAEWVDIEITLHGTGNDVGRLVERTRSLLITMGTAGSHTQGEVLEHVVSHVAIEGVTTHLRTVDIPSWVVHQRH